MCARANTTVFGYYIVFWGDVMAVFHLLKRNQPGLSLTAGCGYGTADTAAQTHRLKAL